MQEAQAPLPPGTVIRKRYIVQGLLGKGSFGNVYLVQDEHHKQKLFALAEVIDPIEQERYRFTLEYVSLAPLDHRALPQVQYVFDDEKPGRIYVLVSFIEDPNLEILRLRQSQKRFLLPQAMALMSPVVDAVTHLHNRHPPVIHQNINPAAIIVSRSAKAPVLAMLNLVKEHDSTTTTLRYFAPGYGAIEQYRGEFSTRTDIYGLGATYYALLTGITPADSFFRSAQLNKGRIDPLRPLNEVMATLPKFIDEAIQRAMSLDANDRFSSIELFQEAVGTPAKQFSASLLSSISSMPSTPPTTPAASMPSLPASAPRQAAERPAPVIKLPPARHVEPQVPVGKRSAASPVQPQNPMVKEGSAHRVQPRVPRFWKPGAVFIVIALLISLGVGAGFRLSARSSPAPQFVTPPPTVSRPTPTPIPTSTTVPASTPVTSIYPILARAYIGTLYDVSVNVSTSMFLTGIQQNQGKISGYLTLGSGVQGSDPFSGAINTTGHLQLIVTNAAGIVELYFEGVMQSATSLSGDYYRCNSVAPAQGSRCSRAPGSYGIWNVAQT